MLTTLYENNGGAVTGTFGTADLSAYQGQTVMLSFETRSHGGSINIDDVSVNDTATEFVTNGDFQTGDLSGWTINNLTTVQNMTSGSRLLLGLNVTRSFYTVPNKSWGRWVDTFSNPTAADISLTVSYSSDLGSDNSGVIYPTPNTANQGLTTWDGSNSDRDIGFAFGNVTDLTYTSDDGLDNNNGSDIITWDNNISVPAGSSVTIVNFIVMNGTDTADTATDITARATDIDNDVANIINRFRIDGQYRDGMTQEQIDNIANM